MEANALPLHMQSNKHKNGISVQRNYHSELSVLLHHDHRKLVSQYKLQQLCLTSVGLRAPHQHCRGKGWVKNGPANHEVPLRRRYKEKKRNYVKMDKIIKEKVMQLRHLQCDYFAH